MLSAVIERQANIPYHKDNVACLTTQQLGYLCCNFAIFRAGIRLGEQRFAVVIESGGYTHCQNFGVNHRIASNEKSTRIYVTLSPEEGRQCACLLG